MVVEVIYPVKSIRPHRIPRHGVDDHGTMAFAQLGTGAESLRVQPSGDSIVVDLRSGGLDASVEVAPFLAQGFADLLGFVDGLAADRHGFAGTRRWESSEGELALEVRHEFRQLQVTVHMRVEGPGWGNDGWRARADLTLEADERLTRFASELRALLTR